MQTIERDELKQALEGDRGPVLINVLGADLFERIRIPGSINIPLDSNRFVERVEERIGDRDADIVVYCSNPQCTASPTAARLLEEAGYRRVRHYPGGLEDWREADYALEGSAVEETA